jgi:hypothetical protein
VDIEPEPRQLSLSSPDAAADEPDAKKPLPKLGFGDRVYLVLADGSPHFVKKTVAEPIFRAAITLNGNEREVLYTDERWVLDDGGP